MDLATCAFFQIVAFFAPLQWPQTVTPDSSSCKVLHREQPTAQRQQNWGVDFDFRQQNKITPLSTSEELNKAGLANKHHREPVVNITHLKPDKEGSEDGWRALRQVIKNTHLTSISETGVVRCLCRAQKILKDNTQTSNSLLTLLPTDKQYRSMQCRAARLQSSFFPRWFSVERVHQVMCWWAGCWVSLVLFNELVLQHMFRK